MTEVAGTSPTTSLRDDCLIVATPSADLVVRRLGQWRCPVTVTSDRRLGLSRLELHDTESAVAHLRQLLWDTDDVEIRRVVREGRGIDPVLRGLRHVFAEEHAGWVPTMGKNRLVDVVRPSQTIQFGGQGAQPSAGPLKRLHRGNGGRDVTVGVVDSVIARHPYFDTRLDPRGHFRRYSPPGDAWHGTFVAGIIARTAPHAAILGHPGGTGDKELESWDVACAIAALADDGLPLVNISLSCQTADDRPPLVFQAARSALGSETVVVAAAGNDASTMNGRANVARPSWPAALDGVVAVGSVRDVANGELSQYSPRMPWVDVYAPGDDVVSAWKVSRDGHSYAMSSGTSFAAATVTGLVAATMRGGSPARALERLLEQSPSSELPVVAP